jgi:hypothetical protein
MRCFGKPGSAARPRLWPNGGLVQTGRFLQNRATRRQARDGPRQTRKAATAGANPNAASKFREWRIQPPCRPHAEPPAPPNNAEPRCTKVPVEEWAGDGSQTDAGAASVVEDSSGNNQPLVWDANNPGNGRHSRASTPHQKATTTLRGEPRDRAQQQPM